MRAISRQQRRCCILMLFAELQPGMGEAIAAHLALHATEQLHGIVALVVAMPCLVGGDHDGLDADGRERAVQCRSEGCRQFSAHRRHPLRGCC